MMGYRMAMAICITFESESVPSPDSREKEREKLTAFIKMPQKILRNRLVGLPNLRGFANRFRQVASFVELGYEDSAIAALYTQEVRRAREFLNLLSAIILKTTYLFSPKFGSGQVEDSPPSLLSLRQ